MSVRLRNICMRHEISLMFVDLILGTNNLPKACSCLLLLCTVASL